MEWVQGGLLVALIVLLLEARISLGNRLVALERDMEWIRSALAKRGIIPPLEHSGA